MKALKNLTSLKDVVKIYVPSTYNVDQKIDNKKFVEGIESGLSNLFGGSTTIEGNGAYTSENGFLITEKINIVYAFCENLDNEKIDSVLTLCEWLKKEMKQECISLEVNNELYFV